MLLVLFIAVDHDVEDDDISSRFMFPNFLTMIVIKGLCYLQLGLTLFYCYLWGKMRAVLSIEKYHQG